MSIDPLGIGMKIWKGLWLSVILLVALPCLSHAQIQDSLRNVVEPVRNAGFGVTGELGGAYDNFAWGASAYLFDGDWEIEARHFYVWRYWDNSISFFGPGTLNFPPSQLTDDALLFGYRAITDGGFSVTLCFGPSVTHGVIRSSELISDFFDGSHFVHLYASTFLHNLGATGDAKLEYEISPYAGFGIRGFVTWSPKFDYAGGAFYLALGLVK
jgi:hypothetical protein